MEVGIFARTFEAPTLAGVLDAVAAHGIRHIQLNTSCMGLSDMPDGLDSAACERARREIDARNIEVVSLSATYNMIHPDPAARSQGMRRLGVLAAHAAELGADLLTLCTGTRNPDNMWADHPQNASPETWSDLLAAMEQALALAEEHNVRLGIEPEVSNVVSSPEKARDLLDAMRSDKVTIVMDGANVFPRGTIHRQHEILDEAFDLLGDHIALAHAKDLSRDGEAGHEAAGTGLLDYDHYLQLLHHSGYRGAVVLHSLTPEQVPGCVRFLQEKLHNYA
ncbi:MAG: sugar phosphate isomerase/epimerase [Caldilineaceae bacterium]|nr:sugar phosphate isomerase/epimerase [Caldilineaceae bacterium]